MPRDGVQLQKVSRSEGNGVNEVVAARERSAVAGREGVRMKKKGCGMNEKERGKWLPRSCLVKMMMPRWKWLWA